MLESTLKIQVEVFCIIDLSVHILRHRPKNILLAIAEAAEDWGEDKRIFCTSHIFSSCRYDEKSQYLIKPINVY